MRAMLGPVRRDRGKPLGFKERMPIVSIQDRFEHIYWDDKQAEEYRS